MKTTAKRSRRNSTDDLNEIPFEKMKPYQLIEKLFEDKPDESYSSQKVLSNEINKHFKSKHSSITQPDVSKAFKRYEMYANVNGEKRLIYQINGVIKLFDANDSYESLIISLAKLNPFAKERVLTLNPNTLAYKLIPEKAENYEDDIKEIFTKCYGSDTIFSIIIHEDLLIVIVDPEGVSDIVEKLTEIPSAVAAHIEEASPKRKKDKEQKNEKSDDEDDE